MVEADESTDLFEYLMISSPDFTRCSAEEENATHG